MNVTCADGNMLTDTVKRNCKQMNHKVLPIILTFLSAVCMLLAGCNADKEPAYIAASTNTAITKFSLKADSKICANLDTVFFSIDLERGVVFNADSLPVGTDVTRLIPVITMADGVSGAVINMTGGSKRTGTVDYLTTPSDSIDFSGQVDITITAADGTTVRSYALKVNVHNENPDSLVWNTKAQSALPSRLANPKEQKTIVSGTTVYTLIEENDGRYTIAKTSAAHPETWEKNRTTFYPRQIRLRSFSATSDALYILCQNGILLESRDEGVTWSDVADRWYSIIGVYDSYLLGLAYDPEDDCIVRATYPPRGERQSAKYGFPLRGASNMTSFTNKWMSEPIAVIVGGDIGNGELTNATWGYDGTQWSNIAEPSALPPVADATVVPYFISKRAGTSWVFNEMSVLLLIGGRLQDGTLNNTVYISYDNGIRWSVAPNTLQLPASFTPRYMADMAVLPRPMQADFEPQRLPYQTDGYTVSWECPYIYIYGGIDADGQLCNSIVSGAINRLKFRPLF